MIRRSSIPKDKKINNKEGIFAQPKNNRLTDFDNPLFLPLLEDERPYDSLTDISVRWLNKVGRQDQPFFLNFCPKLVHGPIMTRDRKRWLIIVKSSVSIFLKIPARFAIPMRLVKTIRIMPAWWIRSTGWSLK